MNPTLRLDLLCSLLEAFMYGAGTLRAHSDYLANGVLRPHLFLEVPRRLHFLDLTVENRSPSSESSPNSSDPIGFKVGFVACRDFRHAEADESSRLCRLTADVH